MAIAVPALEEPAIVLDMSPTVVAFGKVRLKAQRGEEMPVGWMIDRDGKPLTDPKRMDEGHLLPIGDYKGSGLSLIIGILGGLLMAAVIGAISGILIVPITTLYYDTGFLIGLKGFIAAIIGGLVSYPLTAVAALIVGSVEAFSSFYASNFKEVIVFTLILPVLVLRSLAAPAVEEEKD